MSSLSESIKEMRAEFCEGCKSQYTKEEIMNGAQCGSCEKAYEIGKTVATLQD